MYVPPRSRETRVPVLQQAVRDIGFGTLVCVNDGVLHATHLPMMIDAARGPAGTLLGHVARNNPQWQNVDASIAGIATFVGPNFYVTPTWYPTKAQTGKVVPTWNYIAIEARCAIEFFAERTRLLALVDRLTALHESGRERPWSTADAPPSYIETMLGAIIGFEMPIDSLEGAWKLGQHKSAADREGVAAGVAAESDDQAIRALLPLLRPASLEPLSLAPEPGLEPGTR
jgi:transcriptional regulator